MYTHVSNDLQLMNYQMDSPITDAAGDHNAMVGLIEDKLPESFQLLNLRSEVIRISHSVQMLQSRYQPASGYFNTMRLEAVAEHHLSELGSVLSAKKELELEFARVIQEYDQLQGITIRDLQNWQHNQALARNGAPFDDCLYEIQLCFETLVALACKMLHDVTLLICMDMQDSTQLNLFHSHISEAQEMLITSAFIVEKQPPQIIKKSTKEIGSTVRWLIGSQLGISLNSPTVNCVLLSEAQAQSHRSQETRADWSYNPPPNSGVILNNASSMEYNQLTRSFSANFAKMALHSFKRPEKKGTESVMEEKFSFLFYTSVIINQCRICVWALSLPIVVIVHTCQEPQSQATILWDNAFSEIDREPFEVPDKVPWSQLSETLNMKFTAETGRSLTPENLYFIYKKLFPNNVMGVVQQDYITWSQFCKEALPGRPFTFWNWFGAIIKLIKDNLSKLWPAGLIVGFIDKNQATEDILQFNRSGVFLMRFSDSELGAISVAFVNDTFDVINLSPWTATDLKIRGLADRINDLSDLAYVYPLNIPKYDAFKDHFDPEPKRNPVYTPSTLTVTLDTNNLSTTPEVQSFNIAMANIDESEMDRYLIEPESETARPIDELNLIHF